MSARLALALTAVVAGFAALVVLLLPNPGTHAHTARVAVAPAAMIAPVPTADDVFVADLFDGQPTDLAPQQLDGLVDTAHRICDLGQPRAEWLAAMTAPGPHAFTDGEATHLYDSAIAAYCPQRFDPAAFG